MPLHPDAAAFYEELGRAMPLRRLRSLEPAELRALVAGPGPRQPEVHDVVDDEWPGPAGPVSVRIYRPCADPGLPVLVWVHGGGFTAGGLDSTDVHCRLLAAAGCSVVSVDHRHAPEHPYPAAFDDVYAAVEELARRATALGLDRSRIAIGGQSSGGNVAAAVCLAARDRDGPHLVFQLLVVAPLDIDFDLPSARADADPSLAVEDVAHFVEGYLAGAPPEPYAVPMRARSLAGLPPALVVTAELDPLRDAGEAYGRRLALEGTPTTIRRYPGVGHAFFGLPIPGGVEAVAAAIASLRAAFSL